MLRVYRIAIAIALLFSANDALAWATCQAATVSGADTITVLTKNQVICQDNFAGGGTLTSGILQVSGCILDISLDPDTTGAATGAVAQLYRCSLPNTTSCEKMLVDTTGDGLPDDTTLDGIVGAGLLRYGQQNQTARWIYVTITAPGTGDVARVMVICN